MNDNETQTQPENQPETQPQPVLVDGLKINELAETVSPVSDDIKIKIRQLRAEYSRRVYNLIKHDPHLMEQIRTRARVNYAKKRENNPNQRPRGRPRKEQVETIKKPRGRPIQYFE
jgi:hypothetical protein